MVASVSDRPSAEELLDRPDALLTTSHLTELGLSRRAIEAVFRNCPLVSIPGFDRNMVHVRDYLALIESSTYDDDRIVPVRGGVQ